MLEALGDLLNPYSETIGAVAGIVTCLQAFSGAFLLNDIRKRGIADGFSAAPFLGGIVISLLGYKLSAIVNDIAMIRTNLIGVAINAVYLLCFYIYSSEKFRPVIRKQFVYASVFSAFCIAYASIEDPKHIEFRFGTLLTTLLACLVGSPMLGVGEIIRKKSAANLPFPIILCGTMVASLWLTYGISLKNQVLIYQNAFLLVLSAPQLLLCFIYPGPPIQDNEQEKLLKKKK
ncbi:sugar transporter SWEET1-like [Episyrphus balteatus]|uniref:sugar transporter SWEET1-like n=1 Tax=Episyrphus balteatus TaxID=286459 RepID=UPI0024869ACA|nr:sugar transporter SWEET1-like [Episyrphus balteatus]